MIEHPAFDALREGAKAYEHDKYVQDAPKREARHQYLLWSLRTLGIDPTGPDAHIIDEGLIRIGEFVFEQVQAAPYPDGAPIPLRMQDVVPQTPPSELRFEVGFYDAQEHRRTFSRTISKTVRTSEDIKSAQALLVRYMQDIVGDAQRVRAWDREDRETRTLVQAVVEEIVERVKRAYEIDHG